MKNRLYQNEEEYTKFFNFIRGFDSSTDFQLVEFFEWCFMNGFFLNVPDEDIQYCYDENVLCLPLLKNNGITIGMNIYSDSSVYVGIDPSRCFDKTSMCSILAKFPFSSKREKDRFYKLISSLLDKNSPLTKDWVKCAPTSWCGSFASFNV